MTLQVLKYFAAVAYYRSYTKAAKECFITQPALSRAIAGLEEELGCRLFDRNTKQVMLTAEGTLCLQDAQEILAKCEQLRIHAKGTEHLQYHLSVGYTYVGYLSYLSEKLAEVDGMFQLDTEYAAFEQLKRKILKGDLDIMLVPKVNCDTALGLRYVFLERSCLCVMMHKKHRLSQLEKVSVDEIRKERYVAWDEAEVPGANQAHCNTCQENGFTPNYVAVGKKLGDVLMLLQRYDALAMISKNINVALPAEYKVIPIEDSREQYGLVCAWKKDNRMPAIRSLEALLTQGDCAV